METLLQDLRYAWRSLARAPGFAGVVAGVIALGVGANTVIFGIFNAFALRPMPYVEEKRVVRLLTTFPQRGLEENVVSLPDLREVRARSTTFEALAGYVDGQAFLTVGEDAEVFNSAVVSPGLFRVFGATPVLGREFLAEEEAEGKEHESVILGHRLWTERFAADPQVLGKRLRVNGRLRTVVGVAPARFRFPESADLFLPLAYRPAKDVRGARSVYAVGRLKDGVTPAQARAEVATIAEDLARRFPGTNGDVRLKVMGFRAWVLRWMVPVLSVMFAAVGFVLLIVCANVANLLLARGAGRTREIGLRLALGATRGRIVRQLLSESLLIALIGGVGGVLLAVWGRDLLLASIPLELPFWLDFGIDWRILLFSMAVAVLAALLFGTWPAFQVSSVAPHESLKEGGARGTGSRARTRARNALVVAEVALAIVLLSGAGLAIRSFLNRLAEADRLDLEGVLKAQVTLPVARYPEPADRVAFFDALFPAIETLPGVRSTGAVNALPLSRNSWLQDVVREGVDQDLQGNPRQVFFGIVRPGYFRTLGIALRRGRDFTPDDAGDRPRVAIVSESAARRLWPGEDPLGKRFRLGARDTTGPCTVVGMVADVPQRIDNPRPPEHVFVPHAQRPIPTLALVIKAEGDPGALAVALRRLVRSRDPDLALFGVRTMREAARRELWEQRIYASLLTAFAALALVIAAVGIYGVMAFGVAQRTREIGIRMALGAAATDVVRMVVGQALGLTGLGVGIGLAGAFAITRLMEGMLFGVRSSDPVTFVAVAAVLAAIALAAAWGPALRATRVDPMTALRAE